ncbi:MAG: hypothetical protein LBE22_12625 [Azoarcus sp.]|jgi:hypothetical protein|nr:hypothetical protein [Azoarcus sp.]
MEIFLNIINKEPPGDVDEFLDEEMPVFQYCLESLSRFIDGEIILYFSSSKRIVLDIFYDFSVCFEEIVESVVLAKRSTVDAGESIWFFEQGSDFCMDYRVKNDIVHIAFKKGEDVGFPNSEMEDFSVEVDRSEYIEEWTKVFESIAALFEDKLDKKLDEMPF